MSIFDQPVDRENVFGRKLVDVRWKDGRLQKQFEEKYERYSSGRLLCGGTREVWEDVEGEMPAPLQAPDKP